jgi:hypothetical protein
VILPQEYHYLRLLSDGNLFVCRLGYIGLVRSLITGYVRIIENIISLLNGHFILSKASSDHASIIPISKRMKKNENSTDIDHN